MLSHSPAYRGASKHVSAPIPVADTLDFVEGLPVLNERCSPRLGQQFACLLHLRVFEIRIRRLEWNTMPPD